MYLLEDLVSRAVEKARSEKTRVVRPHARQLKKLKTRKRAYPSAVPGSGKSKKPLGGSLNEKITASTY